MLVPMASYGAFELNFQPHSSASNVGTMLEQSVWTGAAVGTRVSSPFLTYKGGQIEIPEIVFIDGDNDGVAEPYYHLIVGSLADGFIQESYIQAGYSMLDGGVFMNRQTPPTSLDTGYEGSASAGNYVATMNTTFTNVVDWVNGSDPLGPANSSGNGTANPRRVVMHQINSDGEMFSYFKKNSLVNKPYIYQGINVFGSMNSTFELDMSNSTYYDDTTAGVISQNTMQLFGDDLPPESANWDMSSDTQNSFVSAGKFTFTDGSDVLGSPGGSEGTYHYVDGDYDVIAVDWEKYYDAHDPTGNPWTIDVNKPLP